MFVIVQGVCGFYTYVTKKKELTLMAFLNYLNNIAIDDSEESQALLSKLENANSAVLKPFAFLKKMEYDITKSNTKIEDTNVFIFMDELQLKFEKGPGDSFGECTSFRKMRALYEVITLSNCNILTLELEDYKEIMNAFVEKKYAPEISEIRTKHSVFRYWLTKYIIMLIQSSKKERINKNEFLYRQFDELPSIFLILNGELETTITVYKKSLRKLMKFIRKSDTSIVQLLTEKKDLKPSDLDSILLSYSKHFFYFLEKENENNHFFQEYYEFMINRNNYEKKGNYTEVDKQNIITLKLKQINNQDILGLEEVSECKKYFFNVKCISQSCEFYRLNLEVMLLINTIYIL